MQMVNYVWSLLLCLILTRISSCSDSVTNGVNNAGFSLFKDSRQEHATSNTLFSPFSVGYSLQSLLLGAHKETHHKLSQFLTSPAQPHVLMQDLHEALLADTEHLQLSISNKMFHHHETSLAQEFLDLFLRHFKTQPYPVNFRSQHLEQSISLINSQISAETNGRIKNLLTKDLITEDVRLVLVNVLYLKGRWQAPFKEYMTKMRPFHLSSTEHVTVPTMHATNDFKYLKTESFQSVALSFKSSSIEMLFFRPTSSLEAVEESVLDHDRLNEYYEKMVFEHIDLQLPKFTLSNKRSLKSNLVNLGLEMLFEEQSADFSRMTASGTRELVLSDVLQETFISVDEEGCEATAATAAVMRLTRSAPTKQEPIQLHLDIPFLYLIRDQTTQTVLFLGIQSHFKGTIIDRTEL